MREKIFLLLTLVLPLFLNAEDQELLAKMKKMSLEEKAYQVMMINLPSSKDLASYIEKEFKKGVPAAVLLFKQNLEATPEETASYISRIKEIFKNMAVKHSFEPIMPLIALDNEGGSVFRTSSLTTYLPSARKIAEKMDVKSSEELFYILAQQMKLLGVDFNLAPLAECGNSLNEAFLKDRTFSTSKDKVVQFANSFIRGMNKAGILCSIKHFPGNGGDDPHGRSSSLSCTIEEFDDVYLYPFRQILNEKHSALSILLSHVSFSAIDSFPFCLSKKGIKEIIRERLKFDSLLLTDDIAMGALKKRGQSSDNAILALEAGSDMIMCSERKISPIIEAIVKKAKEDGTFLERLDEAVFHVLKAKQNIAKIDKDQNIPIAFDAKLFASLKQKGDSIISKIQK